MKRGGYWWKEAKMYELYVDKFAVDFKGLTSRMDYFTALGVNTLHILPHYPSLMIDEGYDVKDYRNVRPDLGTIEDMKECIATAKSAGIHIILDMVLNHVSIEHPWFVDARSSKENSKRNFFLWSDKGEGYALSQNAFPDIKPSNWIANPQTEDYYFATFYPEQPDLNWDNPEVVEAMLANMDFWADMGVDGFRLDAACFLMKREGTICKGLPETHAMIKRIRRHLDEKYPRGVILLGEAAQSVEETKAYFGDGDECQMMYHFPLMAEMWLALQYGDSSGVEKMIATSFDIPENCQWGVFLRNHDEIELRFLPSQEVRSSLLEFLDPRREYMFNKGQATSKRIANIFTEEEKIRKAFELLYSTPGVPIMYYGDEIGMKNLPVRSGIIDTRKYVRGPFDWGEAEKQVTDPLSLFHYAAALVKHSSVVLENMSVLSLSSGELVDKEQVM
jgi:maltose alpha-D-glucosyltransferase/alpha-amylase